VNPTRRRLLSALALPLLPLASQAAARPKRVVVFLDIDPAFVEKVRDFLGGALAAEGFAPGRDVVVETVSIFGRGGQVESLADAVVARRPDAVVVTGSRDALLFRARTREIPIVFRGVGDPVAVGLVQSLARPGGNLTGQTNLSFALDGKRMEVLKALRPKLRRVTLVSPETAVLEITRSGLKKAAEKLGLAVDDITFPSTEEDALVIEKRVLAHQPEALLVQFLDSSSPNMGHFLETLAARNIPAIYANDRIVRAGGLVSLGQATEDFDPGPVRILTRILRGENPGDIPVMLITKTHLALNLRTAHAMGIAIPESLRLQADELVQ